MNNQEIVNLLRSNKYKKYLDNDDLEGLIFNVPVNDRSMIVSFLMFTVGIDLLDQISEIPDHMFSNCQEVEDITIPKNISSIGRGAFSGSSIKKFRIQDGSSISSLPKECFLNCRNLEFVSFPLSVKSIGIDAFKGCDNLKRIVTPKRVKRQDRIKVSDTDISILQPLLAERE